MVDPAAGGSGWGDGGAVADGTGSADGGCWSGRGGSRGMVDRAAGRGRELLG